MADRKELNNQMNAMREQLAEKLKDPSLSSDQRRMLRGLFEQKSKALTSELGDDLQQLNAGKEFRMGNATVSPGIDQSNLVDMASQPSLGKQGMFKKTLGSLGKKAAGIIPLAGAGMAALSGDPAMAAEELAQDAMGPAGLAYEAIKPSDSGNVEEEKQMLAEDKARKNYEQSPARQGKLAKLKSLMGQK